MRAAWPGRYLSGQTPERIDVTVVIERDCLRLDRPDTSPVTWPFPSVRLTQGARPGEHVRLERVDTDEVVVIEDRGFLDSLRRLAPGSAVARSARPLQRPRVMLWVGGTISALVGGYLWALPTFAGLLAAFVPLGWEVDLGNAVADRLAPSESLCDDPRLNAALDRIVARLEGSLTASPYDFRISVVDDSLVNAFAAPGGRIVVMRGLLESSATAEELAGVLAHEIQHVELRHGTRAILRALPLQAAVSMIGDGRGAALIGMFGALSYARGDESEADREGIRLLQAAGVDPQGMIAFFEKLDAQQGSTPAPLTYFSTHPATEERRATLAELAKEGSLRATPIALPADWITIRASCRG
jgi:Zn-dependent protease with chaperone function